MDTPKLNESGVLMRSRSALPVAIVFGVLGSLFVPMAVSSAFGLSSAEREPQLLSAFFGLDDNLPVGANVLCQGGAGQDGMPVVLLHTVDAESLQPDDFRVVTRSGATHTPMCVTLSPAGDPGELRTVLLIGQLGDADGDPPVEVMVEGDLFSDGAAGEPVNYRGTRTPVTPLADGPSLVLAEMVSEGEWFTEGRGTVCPEGVQQVVRVTWAGGVRLPDGSEIGDAERALYRVVVNRPDGSTDEIAPAAVADLGDQDNNHLLCLDTSAPAVSVSFPGGHLVDPNRDLNPDTSVVVQSVSPKAP